MILTIRQLEVFSEVARSGSVTQGAVRAHLTQSATSMSIKKLESALGGPLFSRIGRGLVLNDRGRTLLPAVDAVLAALQELEDLGHEHTAEPTGDLIVGCSATIGNYLMPALIKAFTDAHPGIHVQLRVGNTEEIARAVRNGTVDVGLVEGEVSDLKLHVDRWRRDELVVIAAPGSTLAARKDVSLLELAAQPWVVPQPGSGTRSIVERAFAEHGVRLESVRELGPTAAVKSAVAAGMGLSCLSRFAVTPELGAGSVVEIDSRLLVRRWFYIVTRSSERPSRLMTTLSEWLFESAR
jgi:DNA-binding transcriptional LysR family regulator